MVTGPFHFSVQKTLPFIASKHSINDRYSSTPHCTCSTLPFYKLILEPFVLVEPKLATRQTIPEIPDRESFGDLGTVRNRNGPQTGNSRQTTFSLSAGISGRRLFGTERHCLVLCWLTFYLLLLYQHRGFGTCFEHCVHVSICLYVRLHNLTLVCLSLYLSYYLKFNLCMTMNMYVYVFI